MRLTSEAAGALCFELSLYLPDAEFHSEARVEREGGAVTFAPWPGEPPPAWLSDAAHAALRALWRAHASEPAERWPRRVTRWRAEPQS